jgi:hypothetical protein
MSVSVQAIQAAGLTQVRAGADKRGEVLVPEREGGVRGAAEDRGVWGASGRVPGGGSGVQCVQRVQGEGPQEGHGRAL